MKKNVVGLIGILIVMSLTACGNKTEISEETTQNDVQTDMVYNAYKNKPYSVKLTIVLHPVFSAIIPAGN